MLGERTYSAQETAHLLLGIPLVRTSVTFQNLNLSKNGSLRALVTHRDSYINRPDDLAGLSIHDVFRCYSWRAGAWRSRRATTKVIVRTYPRLSPNPDSPAYEDYCRVKVLLHHPFRAVDELLEDAAGGYRSWSQVFEACRMGHQHSRDTLRSWEHENRPADEEEDEDEEINPDFAELDEADWQVYARLFPDAALPAYDLDDIGRRPLDDGWDLDAS
ncbi:hypothetical protein BV20DRAFT_1000234, partial [Pilatotrama ljubarskyi]